MKGQVIILTLFLGLLSLNGFAKTIESQETEQQKTVKTKYDYNLFKLCFFELKQPQTDSLIYKDKKLPTIKRRMD